MFKLSATTILRSVFHLKFPLKYKLTKIATNSEQILGIILIVLYHLIIIKIEIINPKIPNDSKIIFFGFY